MSHEGDMQQGNRKNVAGKTVDKYISMLRSAFIFFSVGRYDVKGKQLLKTLGKNYIIDMGFRNMLLVIATQIEGTSSKILCSWNSSDATIAFISEKLGKPKLILLQRSRMISFISK